MQSVFKVVRVQLKIITRGHVLAGPDARQLELAEPAPMARFSSRRTFTRRIQLDVQYMRDDGVARRAVCLLPFLIGRNGCLYIINSPNKGKRCSPTRRPGAKTCMLAGDRHPQALRAYEARSELDLVRCEICARSALIF